MISGLSLITLWTFARIWMGGAERGSRAALALQSALLGYCLDSLLVLVGAMRFPLELQLGGPSPLWMVGLWFAFGASLEEALGGLRSRPLLAAVIGAAGGALAYWGGAGIGALEIDEPVYGLSLIGLAWGLALPLLLLRGRAQS